MTIASQYAPAIFQGNGSAVTFPFLWRCFEKQWIRATITTNGTDTDLEQDVDYSVSLLPDTNGGSITLSAPLPTGVQLTLWMQVPITQENAYQNSGTLNVKTLEIAYDKLTLIAQQQQNAIDRAVKVGVTETQKPEELRKTLFAARDTAVASAQQAVQSALDAKEASQYAQASLQEVLLQKDMVVESLQTEGAAQKALVQREGDAQFARIEDAGQHQLEQIVLGNASLDATIATGIAQIQNKGDQQVARVEGVGANQVHLAAQQTALATAEAQRAYHEAERAEEYANAARDLSLGQLPQATENFLGLVKLATKDEAETGLDHTKAMTPLRTAQAIRKLQPVVVEAPTISGPDSTREGAVENFVFRSRSILPATQVVAFSYSIDLTGEETRVDAVQADNGSATANVSLGFGGALGEENTLTVYAVDNVGNQSPMVSKKIAVRLNAAPDLTKVTTDMPAFARAGQVCTVHFSGATDADNDAVSYRLESQHEGLSISPDRFVAAGEDITLTLPSAENLGALTWLGLSLWVRDDFGGESSKLYTLGGVGYVDSPRITSPPHGATGVLHDAAIVVSPFSVHAGVDTAGTMQVQAARDAAFADIVWEYEGEILTQLVPDLPLESVLFLRARHFGKVLGPQGWSDAVQITTVSPSISEPSIVYPVPLATGIPLNPVVRIATPVCVEEIWDKVQCRVKQGASIVYDSGEVPPTAVFATSGVTAINSPHTVEVRVHGSRTGWGAWKSQAFTTLQVYLKPPVFTMPANNTDPTKVTITVAPPEYVAQQLTGGMTVRLAEKVEGLDVEQPTQLWKAEPSTSFVIPNCAYGKSYYVAVWWQGSITGVAKSVSTAPFTTMPPYIRAPQVRGVTQGQVDVLPQPALTIDAFQSAPEGYYSPHPDGSLRVQYKRQSSNALLHDSGWMADKSSYTLPVALPVVTPVSVLVQRRGRRGTGAQAIDLLSAETRVDFTTIDAFVPLPVLTSPTNGATNVSPNPGLTFKAPAPVGQTITKMEVQASTIEDFSTIAWTSGEISFVNSVQVMVADLGTTYHVRARYKGSVTGWTIWGMYSFTTMAQVSWSFTSSGEFTPPKAGRYSVEVHGGNGGNTSNACWAVNSAGGVGGRAKKNTVLDSCPYNVMVGVNGAPAYPSGNSCNGDDGAVQYAPNADPGPSYAGTGGSSSFGVLVTATGGSGAYTYLKRQIYIGGKLLLNLYAGSAGSPGNGVGGDANTTGGSTGPKCIINFIGD